MSQRRRRTYLVQYPSGARFQLTGTLGSIDADESGLVPIIDTRREVVVLDPRAIIRDRASGQVAYHPERMPRAVLAPWAREWLDAHLGWRAAS